MKPKKSTSVLKRLLVFAVAVLVLVLVAVAALSHYAEPWIRTQLRGWAEENGYSHAEITGIGIRVFPLRASMRGLKLEADGAPVLEVAEAGIELSLLKMLRGDSRVDSVGLKGAKVRVDIAENGTIQIGGLTLGGEGKGAGESGKGAGGTPSKKGKYLIKTLKITDSSLEITAPNLELTVHVSDLELREGKEIVAGVLGFQGIKLTIIHNIDDTWQLQSDQGKELATLGTGEKKEEGGLGKAASSLAVSIDKIEITDDSTVTFRQTGPGEDYERIYRLDRAHITDIRSDRSDGVSKFVYEATSNHHERVLLEGEAVLFGKTPDFTVAGDLEGLELISFSPFMKRAAGFAIDSGQADGYLDVEARDGKIEGLVDIRVNLLTISTADKKKLKAFEQTLPGQIKLSTAIRLLSDKQGVVRLKIPVSGDASAPTFDLDMDLGNAINNAVGGIVQTGLLVAAPWAVATINALFVKRPPSRNISFAPLDDVLDEKALKTLAGFADSIRGKEDLLTLICGFATEREMKLLPEEKGSARNRQVLEIAERRARTVKDRLVVEHGIEGRRLILCRPDVNYWDRSTALTDSFGEDDTREPRVELR
jgi:hypothetical protein